MLRDTEWAAVDAVPGWLFRSEAELLDRWNRQGSDRTSWCELGSYKGRSTLVLARHGHGYAVDWFLGSGESACPVGVPSLDEFKANMGDAPNVTIVPLRFDLAVGWVKGPLHLLFLDGKHDWDSTEEAWRLFSPRLTERGVGIFHDAYADDGSREATPWPDVTLFVTSLIDTGDWVEVDAAARCAVLQRRA